ncbi:hypothetical protein [Aliarcobacter butzleri]|uniref:hypothetical protein n=1 Tax=Aliarcobacter butzleri TaxID=28197 RepID=UPI001EDC5601|nr:hypothetical protein [Aliarcobacter butzleri]MCG3685993.1 hypothetical protein [Aliarcobacter butzleri]
MLQILSYILGLVGLKSIKKLLLLPLAVFITAMIIAFYYYIISTLITIYNLINELINYIPQTDSFVYYFFAFANNVGITDGLEQGLPFVFSALVFVLSKILYTHTVDIIKTLFFVAKTFLD